PGDLVSRDLALRLVRGDALADVEQHGLGGTLEVVCSVGGAGPHTRNQRINLGHQDLGRLLHPHPLRAHAVRTHRTWDNAMAPCVTANAPARRYPEVPPPGRQSGGGVASRVAGSGRGDAPAPARFSFVQPLPIIALLNFSVCPTVAATIPSARTMSQSRAARGVVSSTIASGVK